MAAASLPAAAISTAEPADTALTTASIKPGNAEHLIRHDTVKPGRESLLLAAKLRADRGLITRPVKWRIQRILFNANEGEVVFDGSMPEVDLALEPGRYLIEASYGHQKLAKVTEVHEGKRTDLILVLNVGGIRTKSLLASVPYSRNLAAKHAVYALDGERKGEIVAHSMQDELLRVPAGRYLIASRFLSGNTIAESIIEVKPGILTTLALDHQAGLLEITPPAKEQDVVHWHIQNTQNNWQMSGAAPSRVVLAPGKYELVTTVAGKQSPQTVQIGKGQLIKLIPASPAPQPVAE